MHKKFGTWFLKKWEDKILRKFVVPRLPVWIETYHLTLLTIPEGLLCILGGYLAKWDYSFLWLMNIGVFSQYITDILDGELGRYRKTGLVRWGFYMDHLLDYGFLSSILIGYSFITPYEYKWALFLTLAVLGGYFVHNNLYFGATKKFEIAMFGFGTSEARFIFISVNTMLIYFGKVYFTFFLPWILGVIFIGLVISILIKQKELWKLDREGKT